MASSSAIYPSLREKVVIITGGSGGIGAAAVESFCRQGSKVIILDISEEPSTNLISYISTLKSWHPDFPISIPKFYRSDVTDLAQLKQLVDTILREYGSIDVLINNAAAPGGSARQATMDVSPESWQGSMDVNLRHIFFLTQYVVPSMQNKGSGSIINVGSIAWRIPEVGTPVYMAAKAAIMGLTRTHAKEFGASNIRVNSIMPGAIATERQKAEIYASNPAYHERCINHQSLKRDVEPKEVAAVMVFLASDDASAVTGSSYVVDGGHPYPMDRLLYDALRFVANRWRLADGFQSTGEGLDPNTKGQVRSQCVPNDNSTH